MTVATVADVNAVVVEVNGDKGLSTVMALPYPQSLPTFVGSWLLYAAVSAFLSLASQGGLAEMQQNHQGGV